MPSVVNISTSKEVKVPRHPLMDDPLFRRFFGDQLDGETQRASSLGSGVIVGTEGYILTNHHVIEQADEIEVALNDGRQAKARIVGTDPETDLAVLKVELKNLPAITFGTPGPGERRRRGAGDRQPVRRRPDRDAWGSSARSERTHLGINTFENFIQTDAAINPGNSGGALVDSAGNLIGVNTAIYSRSGGSMGIGFAIPVSLARQVMEQIIADRLGDARLDRRRGAGPVTPELAESFKLTNAKGVLIAGVVRGGPADRAGVSPGDILVEVNGKAGAQLLGHAQRGGRGAAGSRWPRSSCCATAIRVALKLTVGKRPKPQPAQRRVAWPAALFFLALLLLVLGVFGGTRRDHGRHQDPDLVEHAQRDRQQELRNHVRRRDHRRDDERRPRSRRDGSRAASQPTRSPSSTSTITTIGTSKVTPKARNMLITKLK